MRKLAPVFLCALLLLLADVQLSYASPSPDSPWTDPTIRTRVEPALLKQLLNAGPNDQIPMIVIMREQQQPKVTGRGLAVALQQSAGRS